MKAKGIVPRRGYLLHLSHYSPAWYLRKRRERPIHLGLALEIIDEIAKAGFNLLIIDCEDGLIYKSHPELRRRYSIPRAALAKILSHARKRKLELVPKLNFSKSPYHRHKHWFRPYSSLADNDQYWGAAFEVIDELIEIFRPRRFFHIGMDEDDARTREEYINAICALGKGLKKRDLRPIIWNDSAQGKSGLWHAGKSLAAEKAIPRDVVQTVWDYNDVKPAILRRLAKQGFEVWVAPGQDPMQVLEWKKAVLKYNCRGLVMTTWMPCRQSNRGRLLNLIETVGPIYGARL